MFATNREESLVATLTIEVTDETYARLQQRALAIGSTPEAIASADVARLSPPKPGRAASAMDRFHRLGRIRRWNQP